MKNSFPSVILSESSRVILSVAKNLAMLSIAAVMFVACGGDNGSSAKDDDSSSSVADEEKSSSSTKNSSSSDNESSSSAKESSSSTVKSSSSSSVILSSSSEGSSSSAKSSSSVASSSSAKSSSSTAKSSSSVASSSSAKSSSSSAKSSSSSVKVSSSSEYKPFDHSIYLAPSMTVGPDRYKQFTDERTGRSYYYITITGRDTSYKANSVTVMAENLNIGEMIRGRTNQEDDSKIERYCYDNDTTNCDKYGGLYQWAEMMALPSRCNTESCADLIQENHQGICPEGWRLLTYNDMYTIVHADGNEDGIKGVRSVPFGGFNTTGYSLVGAGYLWNFAFDGMNSSTYWHYPVERTEKRSNASWATNSSTDFQVASTNKTNGLSVRCVKLETEE
ncbi:FISUMP domain-containing protein [Fibrobacter sp. UWEL]|uniref:FISUMP domain-containing protein n=1 Tax=Fibrobacter sp. UWEL TaxID=1896209 RepID=UPI0009203A1D|nr:FISUMP domain-containing protein [Fibrobacter sp. UWEL]SHL52925.1 major paralogous domain-containing protein [Fibrobacter sp. UWEL]